MNRCKTCVMPDTRPDTPFIDGECAACVSYAKRPEVNWSQRRMDLHAILDRSHFNVDGFNCIVPSSGGKDSTWQTLKLIELGAKPLVVTASTCMLTDVGRRNIDNLARYAQTVEISPNKRVRALLNRIGLETVGDISWPEHVAIFTTPFKAAKEFGIPLIFYGENPQNQYGGPLGTEGAIEMTRRWVMEFGGFNGLRPMDLIGQHGLTHYDMLPYIISVNDIDPFCQALFLGQYLPWDSHENAKEAQRHGMLQHKPCDSNYWDHENQDNSQTGIHDFAMFEKFGYGRGCAQISVDIRAGLIDRATALSWVEAMDGKFPLDYMGVSYRKVAAHIGMSAEQLREELHKWVNWDLFEPCQAGEKLRLKS